MYYYYNIKPLKQWFLTFFVLWTPESEKNSRTHVVSINANVGTLNPCKRGWNGKNTLFCDLREPLRPFPRTPD
jgi:hypothetical protein